jgi:citrate lyase beta subunit
MTEPALGPADLAAVEAALGDDDALRAARYPGDDLSRQPVHTVYVPADRVHAQLTAAWGAEALAALDEHAGDPRRWAWALGRDPDDVASVWHRVRTKLATEPIEDLRVDLEDGYGTRRAADEDADAAAAGKAIAAASDAGALSPFCGVRFKSLESTTRQRGLRSLDIVLGAVLEGLGEAGLPAGWVQTLPKVTSARQVDAMVVACTRLEEAYGLPAGRLRFELQIETAQSILGADGAATVATMIQAAAGRCTGLHFGTYDYTAGLGVAGGYQAMDHPAADHAKQVLQVAAAGTGVRVSDGSTNVLPVGSTDAVRAGWALHARLVTRSLERGFYQGWDLHPAQLPTRFLSTYMFFRRDLSELSARLGVYLHGHPDGAGGSVVDEPATAQAMAAFLLRGVRCGAIDEDEVGQLAGCDVRALRRLAARDLTGLPEDD